LNNDVSKLVIEEKEEEVVDLVPPTNKVDFYGAEQFLINMITI